MNEQKDRQIDQAAQKERELIYTHRSPSSRASEQKTVGGEPETSTGCVERHESLHGEQRAARMPRAALAEEDTGDSPEGDSHGDLPQVPPLVTFAGDRTNYRYVIARLGECSRSKALKYFRGRYSTSDWMEQQKNWLENASLLASVGPFSFNPIRFLYCSKGGKLCFLPHVCTRCNLDQRVEPLQKMFEGTYAKRPFWHSLVLDYEMYADWAGIWTGLRNDRRPLYLPHQGKPDGRFLRCCPHRLMGAKMYCDLLFQVVMCLKKSGAIDGWLAIVEPDLSFWPDSNSPFHRWSDIDHAFLPHIHLLVCGQHPLDDKFIRAIYDALQKFLGTWSYANLWFNPVESQAQIRKWINYCVKPFPLAKWYSDAIHAGCDQSNLNLMFDELALQSCPGLMSRIYSPRRGGVLATNSRDACILDPLPPLLTGEQITQCKDAKFFHDHEDSFWRTMEKRELRRGRNPRFRTMTHKAAVRRISAWEKRDEPG